MSLFLGFDRKFIYSHPEASHYPITAFDLLREMNASYSYIPPLDIDQPMLPSIYPPQTLQEEDGEVSLWAVDPLTFHNRSSDVPIESPSASPIPEEEECNSPPEEQLIEIPAPSIEKEIPKQESPKKVKRLFVVKPSGIVPTEEQMIEYKRVLRTEFARYVFNELSGNGSKNNFTPSHLGFLVTGQRGIQYQNPTDDTDEASIQLVMCIRVIPVTKLYTVLSQVKVETNADLTDIITSMVCASQNKPQRIVMVKQVDLFSPFVSEKNTSRMTKGLIEPQDRLSIGFGQCGQKIRHPSVYLSREALITVIETRFCPHAKLYINHPFTKTFRNILERKVLPLM